MICAFSLGTSVEAESLNRTDTVEVNIAGAYLLEKFFSRSDRAKLFRSWAGAASMMLKGGNDVWGDESSAPDDTPESQLTGGRL